jgi:MarC family membrane protein
MNIYTATITLILVMDPLGNIPIFLSVLNPVEASRRRLIILRESIIAFGILVLFLFAGRHILHGLGITEPALGIAGGIILFLIALKMIFPSSNKDQERFMGEPLIVPLAVPLVAGPSAMATVLLIATQHPHQSLALLAALVMASVVVTVILLFSTALKRLLGEKCLAAVERLMGMILTTVSVQMFLTGVEHYFNFSH